MDILDIDPNSWLARSSISRACASGRRVGALRVDHREPTYFIEDEVIVDAADEDLIERMIDRGGEIVRHVHDSEPPPEFRQLGVGREHPLDLTGLPRSVRIRFATPPDADDVDLASLLTRGDALSADTLAFSSEPARALSSLIAPFTSEGRGIWLNPVGTDHTLPLRRPTEGAGLGYGADPLAWPSMSGPSRIAQAWQLIESLRISRSVNSVVFICICDSGFWFDATGPAGSAADHQISDLGTGLIRWNAVTDSGGINTGPGRKLWHGTKVASAAAAAIGNMRGAAGSGGSVARLCYFEDDRTADSAKTTMIRCTQWGIPFVVYSGGFTSDEFWFGTSAWNDTFNWAADNGTIMIASAGNDNAQLPGDGDSLRPATRTPRAITVGATDSGGSKADFSNWGISVDIWAPGVGIPVVPVPDPAPAGPMGLQVSGTSYSAPLVAGVAAMIRAANPNLNVDQVRAILYDTAWAGQGAVTQGLDAYAAVWAAVRDRMAENATEGSDEQLFPRADGTIRPVFGDAINRRGDNDRFFIDVSSFSTLTFDVQWYELLSTISIDLENVDPERDDPAVSVSSGPGRATLTATIGSGRYRLTLRGSDPTAYRLSGSLRPGRLFPDRFEANNSFATATALRVVPRTPWEAWLIGGSTHGPGGFDLTLHSAATPPATTDQDFFTIDVPNGIQRPRLPQIQLNSDEPIRAALFDENQILLADFRAERSHSINLPVGQKVYLRVTGDVHTRYSLWVGVGFDASVFGRLWPEVIMFPEWWIIPPEHPDWVINPIVLHAIEIDRATIAGGSLSILGSGPALEPADVSVEILRQDESGDVLVSQNPTTALMDVSGLEPGTYLVRLTTCASPSNPITLTPQVPMPAKSESSESELPGHGH